MKILQVIDHLNVGGAERVLVDLSNLLSENNFDVTVLCLLKEAQLDYQLNETIPIIYLNRKNKYSPIYLFRLYKILVQFDLIHIHLRQVLRYVSLLFYTTKLHQKKVILFHDHFGKIETEKELSYSMRMAIRRCSVYIGVSEQLTKWAEFYKLNKSICKLSNIVRITENVKVVSPLSNKIKIVSVGNFRPQKNYEFLCHLIAYSSQDFYYTIYGQIVDVAYYNRIKTLIQKLKIADRVQIITESNSIYGELSKYHLALHCAKSETGPLVALEYLSMQIPYIAYNTGEVAKTVKKKFPMFIQSDFNLESWDAAIKLILEKRSDYILKLQSFYEENYSEDHYVQKCLSIYKKHLKH